MVQEGGGRTSAFLDEGQKAMLSIIVFKHGQRGGGIDIETGIHLFQGLFREKVIMAIILEPQKEGVVWCRHFSSLIGSLRALDGDAGKQQDFMSTQSNLQIFCLVRPAFSPSLFFLSAF